MEEKKREYRFSNAKAVLIILMIFGHYINIMPESWGQNFGMLFIYLFHMPAFILISGYFSKDVEKCNKTAFERYFLAFLLMTIVYTGINGAIMQQFTFRLVRPVFATWFLLVLFYYKLLLKYLLRVPHLFLFSVIAAVGAGLLYGVDDRFTMSRALVFLPVFLTGYYLTEEKLEKLCTVPKWIPAGILLLIAGACGLFTRTYTFNYQVLLNTNSYAELHMGNVQGAGIRLVNLLIAILMTLCLILLMPQKKTFYSFIGDHSMSVYALHAIGYRLCQRIGILDEAAVWPGMLCSLLLTVITVGVLASPPVYAGYRTLLQTVMKAEIRFREGKMKHTSEG